MLGLIIFSEKLPPLWWVGAAGLVVGNVVIGARKEEGDEGKARKGGDGVSEGEGVPLVREGEGGEGYRDEEEDEETVVVDDDLLDLDGEVRSPKGGKQGPNEIR